MLLSNIDTLAVSKKSPSSSLKCLENMKEGIVSRTIFVNPGPKNLLIPSALGDDLSEKDFVNL